MRVRFRLPELLTDRGTNPHALEVASGGAVPARTLYRLNKVSGRVRFIDAELAEALRAALGLREVSELLAFDADDPPAPKPKPRKRA